MDNVRTVRFTPHSNQAIILNHRARFKVVAAGRRFGKTYLALIMCILAALQTCSASGKQWTANSEVVYFAPTLEQARRNAWNLLKDLARPLFGDEPLKVHENTCLLTLPNGVRIRLLGTVDNPDAGRGMDIRFAVLDEYADMPPDVWASVIRPALSATEGGALFIGTPKGHNHFYDIAMSAKIKPTEILPNGMEVEPWKDWEFFEFEQGDNPLISEEEKLALASEYTHGSSVLYEQEIRAKFIKAGGALFHSDQILIEKNEPANGAFYVAMDPAGFRLEKDGRSGKVIKRRDEFAIAVVKVHDKGWWVKEIITGQWTARQAALYLVKAARDVGAHIVGIEKGALMNAMDWFLSEYQRQLNAYINIQPVTHGNTAKYDRIQWALQGRFEKHQISFAPGEYMNKFTTQMVDFPSVYTHDDMLDALAYIDQIAVPFSGLEEEYAETVTGWEPMDIEAGY